MGLIACKECHAQISANAKACPQCGAPIERRGCFSTLIRGAVLIGLLLFLVHLVTRDPDAPPRPRPASAPVVPGDTDKLNDLGAIMKTKGVVTAYELRIWGGTFDLTISSLLPGEARQIAALACDLLRKQGLERAWEVRVFLPTGGERPAATCATR